MTVTLAEILKRILLALAAHDHASPRLHGPEIAIQSATSNFWKLPNTLIHAGYTPFAIIVETLETKNVRLRFPGQQTLYMGFSWMANTNCGKILLFFNNFSNLFARMVFRP